MTNPIHNDVHVEMNLSTNHISMICESTVPALFYVNDNLHKCNVYILLQSQPPAHSILQHT